MSELGSVFVAGHKGLVGSAIVRRLQAGGCERLLLADRSELDLTRQQAVEDWFEAHRPDTVILAAAKVGGIAANNDRPAEFIAENLQIQGNVIDAAHRFGTRKLTFLGSSCIYPREAAQPMAEDALLTGPLEPTNQWYAIAKIAGIKQCQAYRRQYGFDAISLMPTNLYGPGDNFSLENSHVLPAMIRKMHEAKEAGSATVEIWGTGAPLREFLHVDDMADATVYLTERYSSEEIVNVGSGDEVSIGDLARLVARCVGFEGELEFDVSRPDGTPRKRLDTARIEGLGWRPGISLEAGIRSTYGWYLENVDQIRR